MISATRARSSRGFTLIEILVVIVIVGLLASVSVPVYLNQRSKGYDAAMKTELRKVATAQEAYFAENQSYTTDIARLRERGIDFQPSENITITAVSTRGPGGPSAGSDSFCLRADHFNSATPWYWDSADGTPTRTACS